MKQLVSDVLDGRKLPAHEAARLMRGIVEGECSSFEVAGLLTVLRLRGVTLDELEGFRAALLEISRTVDLGASDLIDVCGTGGDRKGSFNISTTTAFVLAGAGYRVAKHGNYASSSTCGSSNVLEALGVMLHSEEDQLRSNLEVAGVCFLHAPLFHPALKVVAEVRRALGVRTVFNMLGPLLNPAQPFSQLCGVYGLEPLRLFGYLLQRLGKKFVVVHSLDGHDEISLTAPARILSHRGDFEFNPEDFGMDRVSPEELHMVGDAREAAALIDRILAGRGTRAQGEVVIANAALAIWCHDDNRDLATCVAEARESLNSGAAGEALKLLQRR
jgi:anthranilate phosphoribosyltransferase